MTLLRNRVIGGDILGSEALLFIRIPQKVSTEEQEGISNAADCMRGMPQPPLWVPGVVVGLWESLDVTLTKGLL
ncbi:hypothetical protein F2P79_001586 [Pimephales promelas]|nr:hypothetical protein F2P79_001586 [Pimephales promelas]